MKAIAVLLSLGMLVAPATFGQTAGEKAEQPAKAGKQGAASAQAKARQKTGDALAQENKKLKEKLAQQEKELKQLRAKLKDLDNELKDLREKNMVLQAKLEGRDLSKARKDVDKYIKMFRGTTDQRFEARERLRKLGKIAVPALVLAAKNEHPYVSQTAVQTLGDIGDPQAVPVLLDILAGKNLELAGHAGPALEKITGQYFGSIGLGESKDEREQVIKQWQEWWKKNADKLLKKKEQLPGRLPIQFYPRGSPRLNSLYLRTPRVLRG